MKRTPYTSTGIFYSSTSITLRTFVLLLLITLLTVSTINLASAWIPDVRPEVIPKQDKILSRFFGNSTDYFRVLDQDETTILIGAKNAIYNISLNGLRENYKHEWRSSDADRELCAAKGKSEQDCHNYIRVFARTSEGHTMLCGTNSYKPMCRYYSVVAGSQPEVASAVTLQQQQQQQQQASTSSPSATTMTSTTTMTTSSSTTSFEIVKEFEGQAVCPYSPSQNSTYIYTGSQLYSATVADFSGSNPLIYRKNLKTEQYDLKQLNQPDFVGAVERNGYVFFFFREVAMEFMNCGKAIYSRVGRVCKNDRGGPYTLSKSWTSFLKTRLNCSVPGEYPFYFDEIQATSKVIEDIAIGRNNRTGGALIYAVFTTSANAIPGSAICAFTIDDILQAFEGRFKSQKDSQSNWLPIQAEGVPEPRPGQCVDDSRTLTSTSVNFVKNHPLMESAVPALYGRPLLTKVTLHHRLTSIAVDPNILALDGRIYDVIFAGTDDGKVTKFINIPPPESSSNTDGGAGEKLKTIVISEMQVLPLGIAVRELIVAHKSDTLVVVSDGEIVSVPLHHCANVIDCQTCLGLQDPNCAWDLNNHECRGLVSVRAHTPKVGTRTFIQSLNTTKKAAIAMCPKSTRGTVAGVGKPQQQQKPSIVASKIGEGGGGGGDEPNRSDDDDQLLIGMKGRTIVSAIGGGGGGAGAGGPNKFNHKDGGGNSADDYDDDGGFILNGFNNDNKITLTSVDPDDLMNSINDPLGIDDFGIEAKKIQLAGKSFYWGFVIMVLGLVFIVGIVIGLYASRRICKTSAFNANHRNQLNPNSRPFTANHRKSGKDVNLLVNTNPFSTMVQCNHKKDNLEQEFVGEKDRRHECKNSTENLEKEIPCKTSTLTKVKRTYI